MSRTPQLAELRALLVTLCETPAPTFGEQARAALVVRLLTDMGFDAQRDAVGNVVAPIPGGSGPRVLIAAHLDTVFSGDTDVRVKTVGERLAAPGIGDNSASLAVTLYYLKLLSEGDAQARPQLTFAATVGEEGLGNLRGMRALMERHAGDFDAVVALDGHLGAVVHRAVGSRRYVVKFQARGGHSWGDFPSPSATHALGEAVYQLSHLPVGSEPRSSLNVGQVWGGTGVNAIAEEAGFNLDLRSTDATVLLRLAQGAEQQLNKVANRHRVTLELRAVGERPAAFIANTGLVGAARDALRAVGVTPKLVASSTDANAAFAAGLPAISFGLYRGGDAHRLSEWLEPASLSVGLRALGELLASLSALSVRDLR